MGAAVSASIGALAKWGLLFALFVVSNEKIVEMVKERADLLQLLVQKAWTEAAELIIFKMGSLSAACKAHFVECFH